MCGGEIQLASYCKIMIHERAQALSIILKFEMKVEGHRYWTEARFFPQYADKILPEQNRSLFYFIRFFAFTHTVSCLSLTVAVHHLCTNFFINVFVLQLHIVYMIIVYLLYGQKKIDSLW